MNVWPRLPLTVATSLAEEVSRLPRATLLERASDWHESAILAPVGGTSVDRAEVRRLQTLARARMHAVIDRGSSEETAKRAFDFELSKLLLEEMRIAPYEAAKPGIWSFIACVVLPDVVRWRFPGEEGAGTPVRRFTDGARGIRNTFGRLWWRAYVLHDPASADPWELVRIVLEDQALGLLERTMLMGYPPLAREMLRAVVASGGTQQQDVMRDLTKRLRRIAGVVPLETLAPDAIGRLVSAELRQSLASLPDTSPVPREQPPPSALTPLSPAAATPTEEHVRTPASTPKPEGPVLSLEIVPALLQPGPLQGVVRVSDALAPVLPALKEDFANPERNVIAVDSEGRRWLWRYVHYNRSRRERQLEGLTGYLQEHRACPGDRLRMRVRSDGFIDVAIVRQAGSTRS